MYAHLKTVLKLLWFQGLLGQKKVAELSFLILGRVISTVETFIKKVEELIEFSSP